MVVTKTYNFSALDKATLDWKEFRIAKMKDQSLDNAFFS